MLKTIIAVLACLPGLPSVAFAWAEGDKPEEYEGAKDHPAVKRYPGSVLSDAFAQREFESCTMPVAASKLERAEGKLYSAYYDFPPKTSCTQVLRNYENAFKAAGLKVFAGAEWPEGMECGTTVFQGDKWVTGVGAGRSGGKIFVTQACGEWNAGTQVAGTLVVVETQAMAQKVEVTTADFMAEEIEKTGRVALYGIQFATGKADITPDSAKALEEIGKLAAAKPDWKLRVEGHTDNVGKAKANLELSKKRAAAVREWLVAKHGVKAPQLVTEGYGDTKPVADNKTDEGKAKNRRVELVKL